MAENYHDKSFDFDKFKYGINLIFKNWALLQGVVKTGWDEGKKKAVVNLVDFFDTKQYRWRKMNNK
jgi:hypothetical protein